MDPISHALLGAASGYSVSRAGGKLAALAGFAGAMLPDADVLIRSASDPLVALEYHRQFSHSLLVAPAGAAIAAVALWLIIRGREPFRSLYWPAFAGYVSAVLLDACTSYGTQLLWPLTDRRYAATTPTCSFTSVSAGFSASAPRAQSSAPQRRAANRSAHMR